MLDNHLPSDSVGQGDHWGVGGAENAEASLKNY